MSKFMEHAMYSFLKDEMLQKYTPRLREWNIHVSDITGCLYRSALNRIHLPPPYPYSLGRMYEGIMWEDVVDHFLKKTIGDHLHNPSYLVTIRDGGEEIHMIATPDLRWVQGRYNTIMEVKRTVYPRLQVTSMSASRYEAHIDKVKELSGYAFPPPQLEKDDYVWETYLLQLAGYRYLLTHDTEHVDEIKLNVIYNDEIKFYDVDPNYLQVSDPNLDIYSYEKIFLMRTIFLSRLMRPDVSMDQLKCLYWFEMTNPIGMFNGVFCKTCPFYHNGMCKGRLPLHTKVANEDEYKIIENLEKMGIVDDVKLSYKSDELHRYLEKQYEYGMRMLNQHCKNVPYTTLELYRIASNMRVIDIKPSHEKEVKEMIE